MYLNSNNVDFFILSSSLILYLIFLILCLFFVIGKESEFECNSSELFFFCIGYLVCFPLAVAGSFFLVFKAFVKIISF